MSESAKSRIEKLEAAIAAERPTCICEDGPTPFGEFLGEGRHCKMTCARCGGFWPPGWTFQFDLFSGKVFSLRPGEKFVNPVPSTGNLSRCRCEGRPPYHTEGPDWDAQRFFVCNKCNGLLTPGMIASLHLKPLTAGSPAGE